jgi:hypothetical protein
MPTAPALVDMQTQVDDTQTFLTSHVDNVHAY